MVVSFTEMMRIMTFSIFKKRIEVEGVIVHDILVLIKYHLNSLENAVDKRLVLYFLDETINPAWTENLCIQEVWLTNGKHLLLLDTFDLNLFGRAKLIIANALMP